MRNSKRIRLYRSRNHPLHFDVSFRIRHVGIHALEIEGRHRRLDTPRPGTRDVVGVHLQCPSTRGYLYDLGATGRNRVRLAVVEFHAPDVDTDEVRRIRRIVKEDKSRGCPRRGRDVDALQGGTGRDGMGIGMVLGQDPDARPEDDGRRDGEDDLHSLRGAVGRRDVDGVRECGREKSAVSKQEAPSLRLGLGLSNPHLLPLGQERRVRLVGSQKRSLFLFHAY